VVDGHFLGLLFEPIDGLVRVRLPLISDQMLNPFSDQVLILDNASIEHSLLAQGGVLSFQALYLRHQVELAIDEAFVFEHTVLQLSSQLDELSLTSLHEFSLTA